VFALIENSVHQHTRDSDSASSENLNPEEAMLDVCLLSTMSSVMQQCSLPIYMVCQSRMFQLLSLLMRMTLAPSRRRVRVASVTNLPGNIERIDNESGSVVLKISIFADRVPGQSNQCSIVCGTLLHCGQLGLTKISAGCWYVWRWIL